MGTNPKDSLHYKLIHFTQKYGLEFETEYFFAEGRSYRFDFYIPLLRLGIEYEGLNASKKQNKGNSGKSRHTTKGGYTEDCRKYNLAIKLGYRLLRYTPINSNELEEDLIYYLQNPPGKF